MSPKEKADELFDEYSYELSNHIFNGTFDIAKQCALIAVGEILKEVPTEILDTYKQEVYFIDNDSYYYWQEVKKEIEKI